MLFSGTSTSIFTGQLLSQPFRPGCPAALERSRKQKSSRAKTKVDSSVRKGGLLVFAVGALK